MVTSKSLTTIEKDDCKDLDAPKVGIDVSF